MTAPTVLAAAVPYPLHRLGWKAFQDLCAAVAEECLKRPVQTFLPTNDAGRDGAFVGTWNEPGADAGSSTIQCKFTSEEGSNLSLSHLADELDKAKALAEKGLAKDYVIMTNHSVTGASEIAIRQAFQAVGVGTCRVFHGPWISDQIRARPRLRMLVPRLYGLGDLSSILDARAYDQAQLILSEMGDNLQKLVVTEAHRKSVRAISEHNLVLLLGSPAAGKSTIGASLAIGAADTWQCATIKSTSPEHLQAHLDPNEPQFFWIDDAWGSTQYQGDRTEAWNQVFPLMLGAMKRGTRFLITSRDYIWNEARKELKIAALPVLGKSQVIINVHELAVEERARILYNHLKLGDQPLKTIATLKPFLPELAKRDDFLPESARRLGNKFFTGNLILTKAGVIDFFARPKEFLQQTIETLAPPSKAAIALVFLNGGSVRSPVPNEMLQPASAAFGVQPAVLRDHLQSLNGSILLLAQDEKGPYWTYKHPTVGDAFAAYVAGSPELVELYLRGADPNSIVREVVCAGITVTGAPVVVPETLYDLLIDRIANLPNYQLKSFITRRANNTFTERLLEARPDLLARVAFFVRPLRGDSDTHFILALHRRGLLPEERRLTFVEEIRASVVDDADESFIEDDAIEDLLTAEEFDELLQLARDEVVDKYEEHIGRVRGAWDKDRDPDDHFDELAQSLKTFASRLYGDEKAEEIKKAVSYRIGIEVFGMQDDYEPPESSEAEVPNAPQKSDSLEELFRDVDE